MQVDRISAIVIVKDALLSNEDGADEHVEEWKNYLTRNIP